MSHILIPTAYLADVDARKVPVEVIEKSRDTLMRATFYKYASSAEGDNSIVSKHTIEQSLTNWSWYWVLLEANFALLVTIIVLWIFSSFPVSWLFFLFILSTGLMRYFKDEARSNALKQLADITKSDDVRKQIKAEFEKL